uniref:Methyltransferase domain-containing protein n=1 Tax=Rhodosorus marinus TaxID=101924 RepID=A0A7S2ZBK6_9RHOD|mmetsp:Transcript_12892/g.51463  ORF Transcript_12892/g.51463 Transcript_12892/m.51463 type:complete len:209 (+) Transcript_12892:89-715(+)|eukprot:CAMPEP_0113963618 /NCGR_PEP_ID=MMETSP0011_2-20120614/6624_1 /TAXON_ID=101924 /ORGANISM="Rhodosorus marinus" /LENGTH=208 /DNA_ID=CAMNT_0000975709 /DNA_START=42 /DNA_END=668 /DNA_ORIENTATION=+ /assembly_acc=CAM_ASM_000156
MVTGISGNANGWEEVWRDLKPGERFDRLSVAPALVDLVETGVLKPPMKILLPGVGRGYEAVYLAKSGFDDIVGIDISPTALKEAQKYSEENGVTGIKYVEGDFFDPQVLTEEYDVVIDFIFKCALVPELQTQWAPRISELLKPRGRLIYFMFPLQEKEGGPPFAQRIPDILEATSSAGLKPENIIDLLPPELAHDIHQGRLGLGIFRK